MLPIFILLGVVIALLLTLLYFVVKRGGVEPTRIELAISKALQAYELDKHIGILATYAQNIQDDYRKLEEMLRVPSERGFLGEMALEQILSDQLPSDMFCIRGEVGGKRPDAYIKSTVGIICIDSKFPLENYRKMREAEGKEKEEFEKKFLDDVRSHLDKIARDYVGPKNGFAEFAFAFIPSESVYYFLVSKASDLLRKYTSEGVQVASPLTLSHKLALIKAGVHAQRLSEQAEKVRNDIDKLSRLFKEIDESWRVFYETHLRNAVSKAEELDGKYRRLRKEFDRISQFSGN